LGSVDGCGDAETPGMKRSESDGVVGSCGVRLDFFKFFAGLSFSVEYPHKSLYVSNGEGIFLWEKSVLDHLKRKRQGQQQSLRQKQTDVVAFFCEFAYRLALSSASNVDKSSTGFEYWL
jgi:hypothetical protein